MFIVKKTTRRIPILENDKKQLCGQYKNQTIPINRESIAIVVDAKAATYLKTIFDKKH